VKTQGKLTSHYKFMRKTCMYIVVFVQDSIIEYLFDLHYANHPSYSYNS